MIDWLGSPLKVRVRVRIMVEVRVEVMVLWLGLWLGLLLRSYLVVIVRLGSGLRSWLR